MMTSAQRAMGDVLVGISRRRIVVVGDIMLDRFIHGSVDRISPEAPVPVLRHEGEHYMSGGAANVARNLAHLGADATLIGVVGKDRHAGILEKLIKKEPAITYRPVAIDKRMTTVKTRFTASGQQILRLDEENNEPIPLSASKRLVKMVERALKSADALILSDYDKGVIDHNTAQAMIKLARKAGRRVIVDPKKPDAAIFEGADLMTPNLDEMRNMTAVSTKTLPDISSAAKVLVKTHKIDAVLVTLGPEGMIYVEKNKPPQHVSSIAKSIYDVSGAGDTVIASFAAALTAGATPGDAMALATTAAGLVVGKSGTATVLPGEILAEVAPRYVNTEQDILKLVQVWRKNGKKVGFTNGCFDQLHPGHIRVLEGAASKCDRLIVGMNSDESTRKLKGPMRPLQTEGRRAAVLTSLPIVDGVVIFDKPTPAELIKTITPDVLVKGGDYQADKVVGAGHVRKHGGKVVIIPTRAGFSTSRLGRKAR
jgi:D-beta-D-heptose 7-phosphate kinase/D-beta-D-heptose 1-phosphate adenosyltransferase